MDEYHGLMSSRKVPGKGNASQFIIQEADSELAFWGVLLGARFGPL